MGIDFNVIGQGKKTNENFKVGVTLGILFLIFVQWFLLNVIILMGYSHYNL
jgi:hypothetical protein